MTEAENKNCINFVSFCNSQIPGYNDFYISQILISHINDLNTLTLEQVAAESSTSIASCSRFIKKAGFRDFQMFKYEFDRFLLLGKMRNEQNQIVNQAEQPITQYVDSVAHNAVGNINATRTNLNTNKFKHLADQLCKSSAVVMIGDIHELACFYTLQLDLLCKNIPTFEYRVGNLTKGVLRLLPKNTTVLLFSVHAKWYVNEINMLIDEAHDNNQYTVLFNQDIHNEFHYTDDVFLYGIDQSVNYGYYSLSYINQMLGKLINKS